ncbi:DUF2846 domain-containing protein [Alkalimonas delamerensis]|uniref:DUF2846 domain-containing protein n=1 Tax=Alkalimonas delamerensis TaxID=265981 RepID=A0ABT9GP76_9GAMM|nr:DUF2846 domain-containing protein [Alkalimonas delamerensis]MDP4528764.1 DUF2846 domain-containing protein [Alkalimonas delamerensis]
MFKHIFLAGIVTVILAACAGPVAKGPMYAPIDALDEYALVYVYRPYANDGVTLCMKFLINDEMNGCLNNLGFLKAKIRPGMHEVALQTNTFMGPKIVEFEGSFEAGKVYFYRYYTTNDSKTIPSDAVSTRYIPAFNATHVLTPKSHEEAELELKHLFESI